MLQSEAVNRSTGNPMTKEKVQNKVDNPMTKEKLQNKGKTIQ